MNKKAAIDPAKAAAVSWVASNVRRPPNLSVTTPAHGPSKSGLLNWAQVTIPTTRTECESR